MSFAETYSRPTYLDSGFGGFRVLGFRAEGLGAFYGVTEGSLFQTT